MGLPPSCRRKAQRPLYINLLNCKYDVLRTVAQRLGWQLAGDEEWDVFWTDTSVSLDRVMRLQSTQKINHFTGMLEICRKKALARAMATMVQAGFADHYNFTPNTLVLPDQLDDLLLLLRGKKRKTFILKPDSGCQGKGIRLVQTGEAALHALQDLGWPDLVACRYIHKPLLVEGRKFDLRVYALVTQCDPLCVFVYREGLARFCTIPYERPQEGNLDSAYMHLTNYAINKHNENFVSNAHGGADEAGSKWSLAALREWMCRQGLDYDAVWKRIQDTVVKSIIAIQPLLRQNYRTALPAPDNDGRSCFEILGFDILLDEACRPWLMEVNHSPSFAVDTPLDATLKEQLVLDTLKLVGISSTRIAKIKLAERKAAEERLLGTAGRTNEAGESKRKQDTYEAHHKGNYTRAYPSSDPCIQALYERLLEGAEKAFAASHHAKVLENIERLQVLKHQRQAEALAEEVRLKARTAMLRNIVLRRGEKHRHQIKHLKQPSVCARVGEVSMAEPTQSAGSPPASSIDEDSLGQPSMAHSARRMIPQLLLSFSDTGAARRQPVLKPARRTSDAVPARFQSRRDMGLIKEDNWASFLVLRSLNTAQSST
ncbi:hypothetical protein WJX72_003284 [[Myrmecia] bisecta]|uniref:Uncharacterized protein n=1 Tax=[Myrmecia] bisecta TaxID=41462 RepID=A0AAW1PND7_9CHLO